MTDRLARNLDQLRQLTDEIAEEIGKPGPEFLDDTSSEVVSERDWYLIGLLGGKEVGKTAVVNALLGREVAVSSSHGPGTEEVLAYVHIERAPQVEEFLRTKVAGAYRILPHREDALRNQVLLDLPDIDSHFEDHVRIAHAMVRNMLYPIWIQSVEKYADRAPAELLRRVAKGNSTENFVFCLNKTDQLEAVGGTAAIEEIREDFSARVGRNLRLSTPPRVWMLSARSPDCYDFPDFRRLLGTERKEDEIHRARTLAGCKQGASLFEWVDECRLERRIERWDAFLETAGTMLEERLGNCLWEEVIPVLESDRGSTSDHVAEALRLRIRSWPLVRLLHAPFSALGRLLRGRFEASKTSLGEAPAPHEIRLGQMGKAIRSRLQSVFASLQQIDPSSCAEVEAGKYWNPQQSEESLERLVLRWEQVARARHESIRKVFGRNRNPLAAAGRLLFTWGACLWFPFGQPLLAAYLSPPEAESLPHLLVQLTGVSYLLETGLFLALYFVFLWLFLRWNTERRVERLQEIWRTGRNDPCSLEDAASEWMEELLTPFVVRRDRLVFLLERTENLKKEMSSDA